MPVEIDIRELEHGLEAESKEVAREAANRWHSAYVEYLLSFGDKYGYDVYPVAQAALPPQWDASEGAYVFKNPHRAAGFFENGTAPHEITPSQADALAFEWPGMRGEPFGDTGKTWDEVFEDSWPTVFLQKVEVKGIKRTDAMKRAERDVIRWMEDQS